MSTVDLDMDIYMFQSTLKKEKDQNFSEYLNKRKGSILG